MQGVLQLPLARLDEGMYTQAARAAALVGDVQQVGADARPARQLLLPHPGGFVESELPHPLCALPRHVDADGALQAHCCAGHTLMVLLVAAGGGGGGGGGPAAAAKGACHRRVPRTAHSQH